MVRDKMPPGSDDIKLLAEYSPLVGEASRSTFVKP
jgi:hypothetical protein